MAPKAGTKFHPSEKAEKNRPGTALDRPPLTIVDGVVFFDNWRLLFYGRVAVEFDVHMIVLGRGNKQKRDAMQGTRCQ